MEQMLVENLKNKWEPVLNCEGMAPIQDDYRRNVTAILLENQEKAFVKKPTSLPPTAHKVVTSSYRWCIQQRWCVSILFLSRSFVAQCLT